MPVPLDGVQHRDRIAFLQGIRPERHVCALEERPKRFHVPGQRHDGERQRGQSESCRHRDGARLPAPEASHEPEQRGPAQKHDGRPLRQHRAAGRQTEAPAPSHVQAAVARQHEIQRQRHHREQREIDEDGPRKEVDDRIEQRQHHGPGADPPVEQPAPDAVDAEYRDRKKQKIRGRDARHREAQDHRDGHAGQVEERRPVLRDLQQLGQREAGRRFEQPQELQGEPGVCGLVVRRRRSIEQQPDAVVDDVEQQNQAEHSKDGSSFRVLPNHGVMLCGWRNSRHHSGQDAEDGPHRRADFHRLVGCDRVRGRTATSAPLPPAATGVGRRCRVPRVRRGQHDLRVFVPGRRPDVRVADNGRQGPGTVARQSPRAARRGCRRLRHRHRDRRNARRRQGRRPDGLAIGRWRPKLEPGGEGERRRRRRAGRPPRDGSARLDSGHGMARSARERNRSSTHRPRATPVARGAGTSSSTNRPRARSASAATRRWRSPRPERSS